MDLRAYLAVLWRWKWVIVICVVLASVVAAVITGVASPVYEASALVVTTKSLYQLQFDPRIISQDNPLPLRTAKSTHDLLARDPALEQLIIDTLGDALPSAERTPAGLDKRLNVREVSNEGVVRLVVSHTDPETAQRIADAWARLYAERLNRLYGQTAQDLTTINAQLETARKNLDAAQVELVKFHQASRLPALQKQLEVQQNTLGTYLGLRDHLDLVIEDAQFLRAQLRAASAPSMGLPTQLAILYLELGSLNVGFKSAYVSPIVLQMPVDQGAFAVASPADQLRYLDDFIVAAQAKKASIVARIAQLEKEIAALQADVETESATLSRLTLARDVAFETYSSLTRTADEARLSVELGGGVARVAGPTVRPTEPASPGLLRNVGLAAAGGLLLGVGGAFALEFIRRRPETQLAAEPPG